MEKQALKELLRNIKSNEYEVPQHINPYELSLVMMDYIGDTDSELRDDLILANLFKWINGEILSTEEVYKLLMISLDENHLFNGIGRNDDTVFSRTFSAELIAYIIYRHRNKSYLSQSDVQNAFNRVLEFYNDDKDVRGYVKDKGWAHGAAHGADVLDEFARCEEIGYEGLRKILDSIYKKITISHYGYIHFEDERIITAFKAILERNVIPMNEIEAWVRSFCSIQKTGVYPDDLVAEFNVNTFLKSLYFRIVNESEYEQLSNVVKEVINHISKFNQ